MLLTGGTLAGLAARGHRVVIVVATDGIVWEASDRRLRELRASAQALGVARVEHLGYADSGYGPVLFPDPPDRVRFVRADLNEAASRLAAIMQEEHAGLLLSYDASGGYGHRDHVRVHEVGARAAQLAGNVRVLEALWPPALRALLLVRSWLGTLNAKQRSPALLASPRAATGRHVNVRRYAAQKQAALAAHSSQYSGTGREARLMRVFLRLPVPVFGALLGYEWFAEPGTGSGRGMRDRTGGLGRGSHRGGSSCSGAGGLQSAERPARALRTCHSIADLSERGGADDADHLLAAGDRGGGELFGY